MFASGSSIPKWQNGRLAEFSIDAPLVYVFDSAGSLVATVVVKISQADPVSINDAAVGPDGQIAVAGTAYGPGGEVTGFLAWYSPAGSAQNYVQVATAGVAQVCFARDGSLWALVRAFDSNREFRELPEYDLLRHYDAKGQMIGSALPRSAVAKGGGYPGTGGYLATTNSGIGFYSSVVGLWVELGDDGSQRGSWKVPLPTDRIPAGATRIDDVVYLAATPKRAMGASSALYRLDLRSGRFDTVDTSALSTESRGFLLLGSDKQEVVLSSGLPNFLWAKVE